MKRPALAIGIAAAAVSLGLTAGTLATWVSTDSAAATAVSFGALTLRSDTVAGVDGPVWFDASIPGEPVLIDPETFLASAGDVIRMGHYFTLEAAGDNLAYRLAVRWDASPSLTEGVTATYTLTEDPGTSDAVVHVAHAPLGAPVTLPDAASGTRRFLLDIDLTYSATRADRSPSETALTDIGEISISADQIREGGQR